MQEKRVLEKLHNDLYDDAMKNRILKYINYEDKKLYNIVAVVCRI